jgi:hypothetical protein
MSRLSRFQARPKEVELKVTNEEGKEETETIKITPFKTKDIELLMDMGKPEKQAKSTKEVLKRVLKENYPDATDEEFDNMSYEYVNKIMEAILEVNGLNEQDVKAKFLEEVKKKQQ